jgi:hypothetical protein
MKYELSCAKLNPAKKVDPRKTAQTHRKKALEDFINQPPESWNVTVLQESVIDEVQADA